MTQTESSMSIRGIRDAVDVKTYLGCLKSKNSAAPGPPLPLGLGPPGPIGPVTATNVPA